MFKVILDNGNVIWVDSGMSIDLDNHQNEIPNVAREYLKSVAHPLNYITFTAGIADIIQCEEGTPTHWMMHHQGWETIDKIYIANYEFRRESGEIGIHSRICGTYESAVKHNQDAREQGYDVTLDYIDEQTALCDIIEQLMRSKNNPSDFYIDENNGTVGIKHFVIGV